MASEIWSAILSGWPSVTDSLVNKKRSRVAKANSLVVSVCRHTKSEQRPTFLFYRCWPVWTKPFSHLHIDAAQLRFDALNGAKKTASAEADAADVLQSI